jgi:hypothetical protein
MRICCRLALLAEAAANSQAQTAGTQSIIA